MLIMALITIGVLLFLRITQKSEWIAVSIKVGPDSVWWTKDPEAWYAYTFTLDEAAYNSFGQKIAQITDIHTIETSRDTVDTVVDVRLRVSIDSRRKQYTFNYQPVLIGKPIEILFQHASLAGVVANVGSSYTYTDKTIDIRLLAEFPWTVERLREGIQAKDSFGRVTAEVLNVQSENAKSYELLDRRGRRLIVPFSDPYRKDAIVKLKVKALEYNGLYYSMSGSPLKVGSDFQVQFPEVAINWALISRVYDE